MNEIAPLIGFAVIILFCVLLIFFSNKKIRSKYPPVFRNIRGANDLRRAIGLTVEDGTRLHISIGSASLIDPTNSSALAALSTLDRLEQLTSTSDLPPMCTSGNGSFQILSQDVSRKNIVETNSSDLKDPSLAQMSGATAFAYAAGTMEAMRDSGVKANVFIGNFGAEAGLLCEASANERTYLLAGSDSIIAQSVFFALAKDTLIGEELYALPAYLGYQPAHQASLRVQDFLRLLILMTMIGIIMMNVLGLI